MSSDRPLWSNDADRAPWKFAPPPFVDGVQEAFVIATVRGALRPVVPDSSNAVVSVEDRWDRLTGVRVLVTDPHVQVVPLDKLVFSRPLQLDTGRLVWLSAFDETVLPIEPEPVPAAQLIRVLTCEADGVACPGYLVVGVNVSP